MESSRGGREGGPEKYNVCLNETSQNPKLEAVRSQSKVRDPQRETVQCLECTEMRKARPTPGMQIWATRGMGATRAGCVTCSPCAQFKTIHFKAATAERHT